MRAEVAVLSRNVVLQGDESSAASMYGMQVGAIAGNILWSTPVPLFTVMLVGRLCPGVSASPASQQLPHHCLTVYKALPGQ
jgi:hypothetical protein